MRVLIKISCSGNRKSTGRVLCHRVVSSMIHNAREVTMPKICLSGARALGNDGWTDRCPFPFDALHICLGSSHSRCFRWGDIERRRFSSSDNPLVEADTFSEILRIGSFLRGIFIERMVIDSFDEYTEKDRRIRKARRLVIFCDVREC